MYKRILLSLLVILLIPSCVPTAPTVAPTTTKESTPKIWWSNAVFYEIFARSFNDSDGNGIGDFNGITQKLDYLEGLGITVVWLMPIFPSPSYHGYDVTDYYSVNPQYGTMDDFKNLLAEAHKRNIRIIIDLVINHTSDKHPWFKEAKKDPTSIHRDWYIWRDTDPKYVGPWGERVWHPSTTGFYYGIFEAFMPDLNYKNPAVTAEMKKIAYFWLTDVGVDGFRLDAAKHLIEEGTLQQNTEATHLWYQNEFYPAIKADNHEAMTVGEVFGDGLNTIANYIKNDQFDLAFNFQLAGSFLESASTGKASYISNTIKVSGKAIPNHQYATFLTNHDQERTMSQLGGDINKAKIASFLMLTSPGTPFIYYGEEIGMQGKKPDENIRLPMQWSADEFAGFSTAKPWRIPNNNYTQVNIEAQTGDINSLLEHYRALIKLRKQHPALYGNEITLIDAHNPGIFSSLRTSSEEKILILANLTGQTISDYSLELNKEVWGKDAQTVVILFGQQQAADLAGSGNLSYQPFARLAPYESYIIQFIP